jgi:uncharacterized protein
MAAKVQTRRVLATLTALASLTALGSTVAVAQTGGARAPAGSPSSPSAPSSTSPSPDKSDKPDKPDKSDKSAASPLHEAARFDHAGAVMKLLLAGADPNARDAQRNTPLHVAIREESENAFNGLLKSPATDVNAINQAGETPLMLAAIKGRLPWVKTLVERGAHVNEAGWSPLHYAASGPNEAVVRWLLEQGAALNARSPNGTTPLMMAAGYGGLSSVEVLLAANADVRLKNDVGLTAADFARRAGQDDLAKKLDERIAKGVRAAGHPVEPSQSK